MKNWLHKIQNNLNKECGSSFCSTRKVPHETSKGHISLMKEELNGIDTKFFLAMPSWCDVTFDKELNDTKNLI